MDQHPALRAPIMTREEAKQAAEKVLAYLVQHGHAPPTIVYGSRRRSRTD